MEFKIGTIFRPGEKSRHYIFTSINNNAILKVIGVRVCNLEVEILSGKEHVGERYEVESKYFLDATLVDVASWPVTNPASDFRVYSPFDVVRL
jgi:hypothetical protein